MLQMSSTLPDPIDLSLDDVRTAAQILRALGHPARLQIIIALANAGGTMTGVQLRDALKSRRRDMLSKHLKELRFVRAVTYPMRATSVTIHPKALMVVGKLLYQASFLSERGAGEKRATPRPVGQRPRRHREPA